MFRVYPIKEVYKRKIMTYQTRKLKENEQIVKCPHCGNWHTITVESNSKIKGDK